MDDGGHAADLALHLLEGFMPREDIKLSFADGILFGRLEKLVDRQVRFDITSTNMMNAFYAPTLAGMSPWVLKDFRSPRRQHPVFESGWNRKGLISPTGQRKEAFGVLADYYARKAATAGK